MCDTTRSKRNEPNRTVVGVTRWAGFFCEPKSPQNGIESPNRSFLLARRSRERTDDCRDAERRRGGNRKLRVTRPRRRPWQLLRAAGRQDERYRQCVVDVLLPPLLLRTRQLARNAAPTSARWRRSSAPEVGAQRQLNPKQDYAHCRKFNNNKNLCGRDGRK